MKITDKTSFSITKLFENNSREKQLFALLNNSRNLIMSTMFAVKQTCIGTLIDTGLSTKQICELGGVAQRTVTKVRSLMDKDNYGRIHNDTPRSGRRPAMTGNELCNTFANPRTPVCELQWARLGRPDGANDQAPSQGHDAWHCGLHGWYHAVILVPKGDQGHICWVHGRLGYVILWMRQVAGDHPFVFQQDGASIHTAKIIQHFLRDELGSDFFWPKSSSPPPSHRIWTPWITPSRPLWRPRPAPLGMIALMPWPTPWTRPGPPCWPIIWDVSAKGSGTTYMV